jgi:hypothetical protein
MKNDFDQRPERNWNAQESASDSCRLFPIIGERTGLERVAMPSRIQRTPAGIWLGLIAILVLASPTATAQSQPQNRPKSEAAFRQLAELAGEWDAVQDGTPVTETYTLTANGSALVIETRPNKEPVMITMVTVDGDHLIATHYCSAGNQPQMVSTDPVDLRKGVAFSLERVTGLKTPDDWHNTGLTITLDDNDHMTQRWTYLYKGQAGSTVFHYTRRR